MTATTARTKRIRRRVAARPHEMMAVAAPGLSAVCLEEARQSDFEGSRAEKGGVVFSGKLPELYRANLCLRTASRVLMRIHQFRATGFAQLEKHLARIPWELYLPTGGPVRVRVRLHRSRLYHSGAVGQRLLALFPGAGETAPAGEPEESGGQQIFLRAADDRFTVSLDSSGDLLYRRGLKVQGGRAPIRETLAAAALLLGGWDGRRPLVAPMCGSGTLAVEAALVAQGIPPGWYRGFAFQRWPAFQPGRWAHLRRELGREIRFSSRAQVWASDVDPTACRALAAVARGREWAGVLRVERADFLSIRPPAGAPTPGTVALNPPYGIRLGNRHRGRRLLTEIGRKLRADWRGWTVALLSVEPDAAARLSLSLRRHVLLHGGRRLYLYSGPVA